MVYAENKTKLSWLIGLGVVCYQNQIRQQHDQTNHIGAVYVENETEMSWSIRPGVVYDEN